MNGTQEVVDPEGSKIKVARYPGGKGGVWFVAGLPGVALIRNQWGWQLQVLGDHPELADCAEARGDQLRDAARALRASDLTHSYFQTRSEGLEASAGLCSVLSPA